MSWDFALILFLLLVITGVIWSLDVLVLRRRRREKGEAAMAQARSASAAMAPEQAADHQRQAYEQASRAPWWVEYGVSFFPVILFVFALRSFVVEPFRIPSGSMLPTLQAGDLILVNKFQYGIRLPVIDKKIIELGSPRRGDVMVFRYPVDPDVDYIKRVVGVPGDEIRYEDKVLYINGERVAESRDGDYFEPDRASYTARYLEQLGERRHHILVDRRAAQHLMAISNYPYRDHCQYTPRGITCKVPDGHYFAMGDNRDNSLDSRYWGFVPDDHVVGRAFLIWMNFSEPGRIGRFH